MPGADQCPRCAAQDLSGTAQVIVFALYHLGWIATRDELWEQVQEESGLRSEPHFRSLLGRLKRIGVISERIDTDDDNRRIVYLHRDPFDEMTRIER